MADLAVAYFAVGKVKEAKRYWKKVIKSDERFNDLDWVAKEHRWPPSMVETARRLIDAL